MAHTRRALIAGFAVLPAFVPTPPLRQRRSDLCCH